MIFKTLTPVFALIVAAALFFTYIQPTFDHVKAVQAETEQYSDAVDKAEQLQQRINELIAARNQISSSDLERLETLAPDRVNEVEFLVSMDALADEYGLRLSNIDVAGGAEASLESLLGSEQSGSSGSRESDNSEAYDTLDLGFTVLGSYENFRAFLMALERSLQFVEIIELRFGEGDEDTNFTDYNITLRTYTLTPINN